MNLMTAALRSRKQAETSQAGRVIESRIEKRTSSDSEGKESLDYKTIVYFSYSVMGQEFTGDRVAFDARSSNRIAAVEVVNRYPPYRKIMVYYNPEKPEQAVLERVSGSGMLQIVIGIVLIFAGIYFSIR